LRFDHLKDITALPQLKETTPLSVFFFVPFCQNNFPNGSKIGPNSPYIQVCLKQKQKNETATHAQHLIVVSAHSIFHRSLGSAEL